MTQTIGYALVVDLWNRRPVIDDGVYLFSTEDEALQFVTDKFVEGDIATIHEGRLLMCDGRGEEVTQKHLLNKYQRCLSDMDYFRIREIKAASQQDISERNKRLFQAAETDNEDGIHAE